MLHECPDKAECFAVHRQRSQWSEACTVYRYQEPQMQRLRPDISSSTSPQPTLTAAIFESGWVEVLPLTATSCTTNKSLVYDIINLCVIILLIRNT